MERLTVLGQGLLQLLLLLLGERCEGAGVLHLALHLLHCTSQLPLSQCEGNYLQEGASALRYDNMISLEVPNQIGLQSPEVSCWLRHTWLEQCSSECGLTGRRIPVGSVWTASLSR